VIPRNETAAGIHKLNKTIWRFFWSELVGEARVFELTKTPKSEIVSCRMADGRYFEFPLIHAAIAASHVNFNALPWGYLERGSESLELDDKFTGVALTQT